MRFHCLGVPHTVTSHDYVGCAFTQKVLKFCKMMKARGHYIIHYGHEDSQVDCDEHVTVITNNDLEIAYGDHDWRKNFYKYDLNDHAYSTFYKNAIDEVGKRKQQFDFILPFWGHGVRPVCDAHQDMICVEPGIGYPGGTWAQWRVYESYALLHADLGIKSVGECINSWYHVVIPNYFDPDDFEYSDQKEDYALFLGRICTGKGIEVALQVTKSIGIKLKVAGQGDLTQFCDNGIIPDNVEYIGYADLETRKKLMSKAKFGIVSSMYTEPFGGVQVEFLLSGTPTITTDWGAFVENNIHGVTGYRCRTFEQFCWAAKNIDTIKPIDCRNYAMNNFTLDKVGGMYEEYFNMVMNVHKEKGWYETFPHRPSLNWLDRNEKEKTLGDVFLKHKTDKLYNNMYGHSYNKKYEELFKSIRHKKLKIFEMGLGTVDSSIPSSMHFISGYTPCASHRAWREYFTHPETEVYGGDIDGSICDNIHTFQVDQTNKEQLESLFHKLGNFDIIIDDGLHTSDAAKSMFDVAFKFLNEDGYYIIEDIMDGDLKWSHKCLREVWSEPKKIGHVHDNVLHIFRKIPMRLGRDFPFNEKNKNVAIWIENSWAFGRTHNDIINELKYDFNFVFYDWRDHAQNKEMWENWREFDVIIGNWGVAGYQVEAGLLPSIPYELKKKLLPVIHHELINHPEFTEKILFKDNEVKYCGVTDVVCNNVKQASGNSDVPLLKIGVDINKFNRIKNVEVIKTIGFVGKPDAKHDIKRPMMAKEIAEKCGLNIEFIYSKPFELAGRLYDNIDLLLVTSTAEGVGTSICEAAACHIPVVSTKVGYATQLRNIKTFETVEEAVDIINALKDNPKEYTDRLALEVRTEWNWTKIAHEYWKPIINSFDNEQMVHG